MKGFLIFAFLLLGTGAFAQDAVPAAVEKAFNSKFPGNELISWSGSNEDFEAEFYIGDESYFAKFSSSGEWIETSQMVYEEDLPESVLNALTAKYPEGYVQGAFKVTDGSGSFYRVDVSGDENTTRNHLSPQGKILDSFVMEESSSEDDDW